MYNRMKDLLRQEYGSSRAGVLVEEPEDFSIEEADSESWIDLKDMLHSLGGTAKAIVDMLLEGDDRLTFELMLADMRRAYVYKKGRYKLSVKPFMIARALGIPIDEVMTAIDEIKNTLRQT